VAKAPKSSVFLRIKRTLLRLPGEPPRKAERCWSSTAAMARWEWKEDYEWGQHVEDMHDPQAAAHATIRVVSVVEAEEKRWIVEGDAAHGSHPFPAR